MPLDPVVALPGGPETVAPEMYPPVLESLIEKVIFVVPQDTERAKVVGEAKEMRRTTTPTRIKIFARGALIFNAVRPRHYQGTL